MHTYPARYLLALVLCAAPACGQPSTPRTAPTTSAGAPADAGAARPDARVASGGELPVSDCVGTCSVLHHAHDAGAAEEIEGTIDVAAVGAVLRREARSLRQCYERAARTRSGLVGRIDVRFTIDTEGRVRGTPETEGMAEAPEVGTCVGFRVRFIRFPEADGGPVEVTFPLDFH